MSFIVRCVIKQANKIALIGTLFAIVGAFYSVKLYKNLHPDIEELLPESIRSVKDFDAVARRLRSVESLVVLVTSPEPANNRRFVEALGARLKTVPKEVLYLSTYRFQEEMEFFNPRQPLFIDKSDLIKIKNFIKERYAYEKKYAFSIFPSKDLPKKPELDVKSLEKKYKSENGELSNFPDGYFATQDEKVYLLIAYLPGKGLEKAHQMKAAIEKEVAALNPKSFAPDLEVKYTGNVENLIEESAALVEDLEFSTVVVLLLTTFVIVMFFKSIRGTLALLFSLMMGVCWTFGVAYFGVSYLNANTAFLASIVIGNGINFGIIFLARYLEERRKGIFFENCVEIAMTKTAPATIVAAIACGLSYGSLMLTSFRGFNQFGFIGLTGMALCWISAYTLLPAYLILINRWSKKGWIPKPIQKSVFSDYLAHAIQKHYKTICAGVVVISLVSIGGFLRWNSHFIETDLSQLKDKRSQKYGSGSLYHYIDDIFQHSLSPMVALPESREKAKEIATLLREKRSQDGEASKISTIQTLFDFVPENQKEKLPIIYEIKKLIKPSMLAGLSSKDRKLIKEFLKVKEIKPFEEHELPKNILARFRENDGSIGKVVVLDKKIETSGKDDAFTITKFVNDARDIVDKVAPGTPVAGSLPIISDMISAIQNDGPTTTIFAFVAVILLLVVLFRDVRTISMAVFSLVLGVFWFAAFIIGFRLKINFLNFIAIPITFGIGVDYGINCFQRYREEGNSNILGVIRNTGGAIILCSLTTVIGYGSLLLAGNQAFVTFGTLAVVGEIACLAAAVVALPALLVWNGKRKEKKVPEASPSVEEEKMAAS